MYSFIIYIFLFLFITDVFKEYKRNTDQVVGQQIKVSHPDLDEYLRLLCEKLGGVQPKGYKSKGETYYYFQVAEDAE